MAWKAAANSAGSKQHFRTCPGCSTMAARMPSINSGSGIPLEQQSKQAGLDV
jgi:hypothetical protein